MRKLAPPSGRWREDDSDREEREGKRLKWHARFAQRVSEVLDIFRPQVVFSRPASLGADTTLHVTLKQARDPKPKKADRALANTFYEWRNQVMVAESKDLGNIECLLRCAHNASADTSATAAVRALVNHVGHTWDVKVPWPFETSTDITEFAVKASRNESTLASWLFYGHRAPRYVLSDDGIVEDTDD